VTKHRDLEREIADLRRRLHEIERVAAGLGADEPLPAEGALEVVVCRVEESRIALPLPTVERVIPAAQTAPLPESPPWVHGLLRLRGEAIAVLDVAARIGRRRRELELDDHIVICRDEGIPVGLVVGEVLGVQTLALGASAESGDVPGVPRGPYVRAALHSPEGLVLLLSLRRLLETSDLPPLDAAPDAPEAPAP
jgi:purine-binding chemotaxis protein CheW